MTEPMNSEPEAQQRETTKDIHTIKATDRMAQALELRKAGHAYEAIAKQLHFASKSGAYGAVKTALRRTLQEPADEVRRLECERLDLMQAGLWRAAIAGDTKAVASVLVIMDRRAKLLGLDAPTKVDIQGRLRDWAMSEGLDPNDVLAEAQAVLAERTGLG